MDIFLVATSFGPALGPI